MFVALLLLPVMETSRGPAWLSSCTSVFLSLCHPGHDEHKQGEAQGGVFQNRGGQQRKNNNKKKKTREESDTIHINWPLIKIDRSQGKTLWFCCSSQLQNKMRKVLLASLPRRFGCMGIFGAKLAESTRD